MSNEQAKIDFEAAHERIAREATRAVAAEEEALRLRRSFGEYVYRAFCPIPNCDYDSDPYETPGEAERDLAAHLSKHAKDRVRVISR